MTQSLCIETEKPVAYDSPDHLEPWGTARDNSTNPWFNRKLFTYIPAKRLRVLDLGCSGGGFVRSVLEGGGFAVGVEGSDYSRKHKRAEWATIPDHLFTADITVPFKLYREGPTGREPLKFNVVTAWELLEHLAEDQIAGAVRNIISHMSDHAIFLASIASFEDVVNGVRLHQSVHELPWWIERFSEMGLQHLPIIEKYFFCDWVRGGPGTASFAVAFCREGDTIPSPLRLKLAKLPFLAHETGIRLGWRLKR
jgi:hypothetical protein